MAIDPKSNAALEVTDQAAYANILKYAPIMELVNYTKVSLDEAVKMRLDAFAESYSPKMEITARPIEPQGNLYGFASVNVGGIRIDDFKIVENKDGEFFVGMPSKPDKTSNTGYRNTVQIDKDFRDEFNTAVLNEYRTAVERTQTRASNLRTAPPETPLRMADQMAKAAKEAESHNATLSQKEKGIKTRKARGE